MSRDDIVAGLREMIGGIAGVDMEDISDNMELRDISGWDSMKQVKMVVAVKKKYGIDIQFSDIKSLIDISKTADYIEKNINQIENVL